MTAPKFAGMSGNLLMRAVTTAATMGFLLFGYDRMSRECSESSHPLVPS
jgi:hypothetical protein